MTILNTNTPRIWTKAELEDQAQFALDEFVDRRLAESTSGYLAHLKAHRKTMIRLLRTLALVNPQNPDPKVVKKVLLDKELFDALRYVSGPPVSEDDLGVLVSRKVEGINKSSIKSDDKLATDVLNLICKLADSHRFPWIAEGGRPTKSQIYRAIQTTVGIQATQSFQTERRKYGKKVEQKLEIRLLNLGFAKRLAPNKGKITAPMHYPATQTFYGECTIHDRKVDLFIALPTGRMIALEAKDSSSALNSVKRLNNDTAAKAKHFATEGGRNIINVALLSGVFKVSSLLSAQEAGLYIVWAHALDEFIDWITSQSN